MRLTKENLAEELPKVLHLLPSNLSDKEVYQTVIDSVEFYDDDAELKELVDTFLQQANDALEASAEEPSYVEEEEEEPKREEKPRKENKPKGEKGEKKPKTPKEKKEPKPKVDPYAERVNYPDVQVRLADRFRRLHGKAFNSRQKEEAVKILKALQKAIVNHEIRSEGHGAASAYAAEMRKMQEVLVNMANSKCDASHTIELADHETYVRIAKAQGSKAATEVMRSFVRLVGKSDGKAEESLLKKVEKVLDKKEAGDYENVCKQIREALKDAISSGDPVEAMAQTLDGIGDVLGGKVGVASKKKEVAMTADALCGAHFDMMRFTGKWQRIIGSPTQPYKVMIYGNAGSGKSTLALQFAGYLAEAHGQRVLYYASEEGLSYTMQEKLRRFGISSDNLTISTKLPNDLGKYDVIFIDSVNHAGLEAEDLRKLPQGKSYVYVFQSTKAGSFRGTNDFLHDVDCSVRVENMRAYAEKNRFGAKGECDVEE